jgi:hypothetical protein
MRRGAAQQLRRSWPRSYHESWRIRSRAATLLLDLSGIPSPNRRCRARRLRSYAGSKAAGDGTDRSRSRSCETTVDSTGAARGERTVAAEEFRPTAMRATATSASSRWCERGTRVYPPIAPAPARRLFRGHRPADERRGRQRGRSLRVRGARHDAHRRGRLISASANVARNDRARARAIADSLGATATAVAVRRQHVLAAQAIMGALGDQATGRASCSSQAHAEGQWMDALALRHRARTPSRVRSVRGAHRPSDDGGTDSEAGGRRRDFRHGQRRVPVSTPGPPRDIARDVFGLDAPPSRSRASAIKNFLLDVVPRGERRVLKIASAA